MELYLKETALLDFNHPSVTELVNTRGWYALDEYERIASIYDFVQNEIAFGYNVADDITASQVCYDGYGQCNTRGAC